jgi:hypothetical protein
MSFGIKDMFQNPAFLSSAAFSADAALRAPLPELGGQARSVRLRPKHEAKKKHENQN